MRPTPAEAFSTISTMKPIPLEGTLAHCHVNPGNMPTVPIYSLGKKNQAKSTLTFNVLWRTRTREDVFSFLYLKEDIVQ